MRVLHVVPELFPVLKTGGLADVAAALPPAQALRGIDARILLPGYRSVHAAAEQYETVMTDPGLFWGGPAQIVLCRLRGVEVPVYILDSTGLFDRPGGPYIAPSGEDWPDNHLRFAALGWAAAWLARDHGPHHWRPDIVHGHDWQAGLAPAYMAHDPATWGVRTVMTIHNIAYQGFFPAGVFPDLALPPRAYAVGGVEFYNGVGFLKAGLYYANKITTVSRTYAHEIQGFEAGNGFDGLLRTRSHDLVGILNGVDYHHWNPASDRHLPRSYDLDHMEGKAACKAELQRRLGLDIDPEAPLFGVVGRLAWLKGMDLMLGAVTAMVHAGAQLAVLGNGAHYLEEGFRWVQAVFPGRIGCYIGFDESMSHLIQGGSDVILVPSRTEPCGLTQLYGLRYGTLPLVRRVGGLAETVVNAEPHHLADGTATGFVFDDATTEALAGTILWACSLYRDRERWRQMQRTGMHQDFSWNVAAAEYQKLYEGLLRA